MWPLHHKADLNFNNIGACYGNSGFKWVILELKVYIDICDKVGVVNTPIVWLMMIAVMAGQDCQLELHLLTLFVI